jgi:tetratricopeptide (TPR) repeat protein
MIDDLRGLGKVYLQLDDPSQARSSLEEALASARELGVGRIIGAVLRDLADLFLRIGDEEQSLALLQESLSLSSQHDDWRGVVESLEALAELSARQSHPQLAARLLGSAAGLRSSTGPRRTPREQAAAVRRVKAIRICLEQAQFDRAWEEGRHLSGSQAIELALQAANRN